MRSTVPVGGGRSSLVLGLCRDRTKVYAPTHDCYARGGVRTEIDILINDPLNGYMPITSFNSFTDGLEPSRRSREHFITNTNLDDDRLWVPYANGVWFQPCCFNVTSGGFSVVLKGLPGSMVGTHYHVGTVYGYTMRGHWRYLEHDWIAKPGTYIYEPAGEAHTLVIT